MAKPYPFTWAENSIEDQERRAKCWTAHISIAVESVVSHPMEVNMPKSFVQRKVHERIWNMKPRPDDIWIVTYPKSGTTMGQELLWQMSRGCNVDSDESKKQLFERSPFLGMGGLMKECACEQCKNAPKVSGYVIMGNRDNIYGLHK